MTASQYLAYWWKYFDGLIAPSILATLRMLSASMAFSLVLGFGVAVLLVLYGPQGLRPAARPYRVIDFMVNSIRSFPIIILIVAISPITRMLVGTTKTRNPV